MKSKIVNLQPHRRNPQHPVTKAFIYLALFAAAASSPPMRAQTGPTLPEPVVIKSSGNGLSVDLNLAVAQSKVADRKLETATYNGTIPGPTFRVKPGDIMKINLINNLAAIGQKPPPQKIVDCGDTGSNADPMGDMTKMPDPSIFLMSNLHTHGLQVSPTGNGDNPYIDLAPGQTCKYAITIPGQSNSSNPFTPPQPAGLHWYHPHRHMSASKQTWAGLAGAIIVEGDIDKIPEVAAAKERLLILQELWVDDKGQVPAGMVLPVAGSAGTQAVQGTEVPFTTSPPTPTNIYYVVNGAYQPTIPIQPGETQRWRILNASPHRVYQLSIDGNPEIRQIAQDGISLSEALPIDQSANPIIMAPGNRVEIILRYADQGAFALRAVPFDQGHPGGALPEVVLANIESSGKPVTGTKMPDKLIPQENLNKVEAKVRKDPIVFSGTILPAPVQFFINKEQFDPTMKPITAKAGTVEEWTLINQDVFQHPFHIHVNPFQVVEINGKKVDKPIWWDTFMLPPKTLDNKGKEVFSRVKIRIRFRSDVTGKTVFHCHFLPHEDNGMMSVFELLPNTK